MAASDLRILIVEDDPDHRNDLVTAITSDKDIKNYNPKIAEASSLSELEDIWAEQFDKTLPEVAILDHRLPGRVNEDGTQVALWLLGKVPTIRIIVHSAYPFDQSTDGEDAFRAYERLPNPANIQDQVVFIEKKARTITSNDEMVIITVWQEVRPVLLQAIKSKRGEVSKKYRDLCDRLCAYSPAFQECLKQVEKVMENDVNVLLIGETGTGKNVIAREIHNGSKRHNGPFVNVNCGREPNGLFEGLFFGGVKGPFPDAVGEHAGYFEQANEGTIFLDEVTEIPPKLQVKFNDIVQDKELQKLGAKKKTTLNIRVLSASNRDIEAEVERGSFKNDLYFRLAGERIHIPALRERVEDIIPLAEYLLQKVSEKSEGKYSTHYFSESAKKVLTEYSWPGNVRELESAIEKVLTNVGTERHQIAPTDFRFLIESRKKKQQQGGKSEETTIDGKEDSSKRMASLGEWWSELDIEQLIELSRKIWETRGDVIDYDVNKILVMSSGFKGRSWMYVKAILAIFWQAHRDNNVVLTEELFCEIFGFTKKNPFHVWLHAKGKGVKNSEIFPKSGNGDSYCFSKSFKSEAIDLKKKGIFLTLNNYQREDREAR